MTYLSRGKSSMCETAFMSTRSFLNGNHSISEKMANYQLK